jgi:hypothetical protein
LCFDDPGRHARQEGKAAEHKAHQRGLTARFLRHDVRRLGELAGAWRVDAIEPATLDSLTDPDGIPAWLVALTRI